MSKHLFFSVPLFYLARETLLPPVGLVVRSLYGMLKLPFLPSPSLMIPQMTIVQMVSTVQEIHNPPLV